MPFDDDGVEVLSPGHFLIGHPLNSLSDPSFTCRPTSRLRHWHPHVFGNDGMQSLRNMQSGIALPGTAVWEM